VVKLKIIEAEPSIQQLEEKFTVWQTQNPYFEVISVQSVPAGGAFGKPQFALHVWHRRKGKGSSTPPPVVTTR